MTEWLTRERAAQVADVHPRTIDAWRKNGLPSTTIGRVVRIDRDDLDEYMRRPEFATAALVSPAA